MDDTVSCIITSYNNGEWLKQSVTSALAQTRPIDEIIIADDGSSDGSRELIESLAGEHKQIRPILREQNLGVSANRDLAVREASGHWITTLDGDDFYAQEKIEIELATLEGAGDEAVAYSSVCWIDDEGKLLQCVTYPNFSGQSKDEFIRALFLRQFALPRDMLYAKDLFLKVGGYRHDLRMFEDWDLKLRLAKVTGPWLHSYGVGMAYRRHAGGLSKSNNFDISLAMMNVFAANRDWLEEKFGAEAVEAAVMLALRPEKNRLDSGANQETPGQPGMPRPRMAEKPDDLLQTGIEEYRKKNFADAAALMRQAFDEKPELAQDGNVVLAHAELLSAPWQDITGHLPPGTNMLQTAGWLNSVHEGVPVNAEGRPIPWYTYPAIDFVEEKIAPHFNVFEWGGGQSTLWWAERVAEIHTAESDKSWHDRIKARMPDKVILTLAENDADYAAVIAGCPDRYFDVIVIDGAARNLCAARAARHLKSDGFIIFDNSDRMSFDEGVAHLEEEGFQRVDFFGLIPCYLYRNCTSVFFRDSNMLSRGARPAQKTSSLGPTCSQALGQ